MKRMVTKRMATQSQKRLSDRNSASIIIDLPMIRSSLEDERWLESLGVLGGGTVIQGY